MTKNPLALAAEPKRAWNLDDFCDESNRFAWVKASGRPYFLSIKHDGDGNPMLDKDGVPIRYLDRNA